MVWTLAAEDDDVVPFSRSVVLKRTVIWRNPKIGALHRFAALAGAQTDTMPDMDCVVANATSPSHCLRGLMRNHRSTHISAVGCS